MSGSSPELVRFLIAHYDRLKRKLAFRLGSTQMAEDALQDTYLRLSTHQTSAPVRDPQNFVVRTATNLAIDRIRADRHLLSGEDVERLLDEESGSIDPVDAVSARLDLEEVARALRGLPTLRRRLFLASRFDGIPQKELARLHGISLRKVELEIHLAHKFCAEQIQREKK